MDASPNSSQTANDPNRDRSAPPKPIHERNQTSTASNQRVDPERQERDGPDGKREKAPFTPLEILNVVFNGILAATAITGAVVIGKQLSLMRRQMGDAEQSAKDARKDTERALGIADRQAISLAVLAASNEASIATAKESMRLDQRAWVGMHTVITPVLEVGKPLQMGIVIRNSGKTPALDLGYHIWTQLVNGTHESLRSCEMWEPIPKDEYLHSRQVLHPNQPGRLFAAPTLGTHDFMVTQELFDSIHGRANVIICRARIWYKDVFGVDHETGYFGVYNPAENTLDFGEIGNYVT